MPKRSGVNARVEAVRLVRARALANRRSEDGADSQHDAFALEPDLLGQRQTERGLVHVAGMMANKQGVWSQCPAGHLLACAYFLFLFYLFIYFFFPIIT